MALLDAKNHIVEWKPILEVPNYEISSLGQVKNSKTANILKITPDGSVHVVLNKKQKVLSIAKLMRFYFPLPENPDEIWKDIDGCNNYQVSNLGKIRNKSNSRILKTSIKGGYLHASISQQNSGYRVHVLVAKAFLINDDPTFKTIVNHKNGNKLDNKVSNLEFVTPSRNSQHAVDTGLRNTYSRTVVQRDLITKEIIKKYKSAREASRQLGIKHQNISAVCLNQSKSAGSFWWTFENKEREGRTEEDMKSKPNEIWKEIPETNHMISNLGRVKNAKTGHCLKLIRNFDGRDRIPLRTAGVKKYYYVALIVASAFLPAPLSSNHNQVDHIDRNKENNCVENLRWVTSTENIRHSKAKKVNQYDMDHKFLKSYDCIVDALNAVPGSSVSECCQGKIKQSKGFIWRYAEHRDENEEIQPAAKKQKISA